MLGTDINVSLTADVPARSHEGGFTYGSIQSAGLLKVLLLHGRPVQSILTSLASIQPCCN